MTEYDVAVDPAKLNRPDFNVTVLKPEYVLKVNNIPVEKPVQAKSVQPKSNPNPENLPAVRVKKVHKGKKVFLYVFFFLFIFSVCAIIGYKTVFYLFTI